jgi:hypothetical protein
MRTMHRKESDCCQNPINNIKTITLINVGFLISRHRILIEFVVESTYN